MKLSPRTEGLAYRIWAVANPRGWDMTEAEIAEALGVSQPAVRRACQLKGWGTRLRKTSCATHQGLALPAHGFGIGASAADTIAHYASLAEASE